MDVERVIDGKWQCRHIDGSARTLREADRQEAPPHYVICPDCWTHWVIRTGETLATPVITDEDVEDRAEYAREVADCPEAVADEDWGVDDWNDEDWDDEDWDDDDDDDQRTIFGYDPDEDDL